ncbi:alpha/beta hydrolase [bacterium SCSIO 12827]|nr:alpha/beta hydrolase [bacterium SCSIO 12827]
MRMTKLPGMGMREHMQPARIMTYLRITAAFGVTYVLMTAAASTTLAQSTLERVKARGAVTCVTWQQPYFFSHYGKGGGRGMDADSCRAAAAAVFGDHKRVKYVLGQRSFNEIVVAAVQGEIDLIPRVSWQSIQKFKKTMRPTSPVFMDGQGILLFDPGQRGVSADLGGKTICTYSGHKYEKRLRDYQQTSGMAFKIDSKLFESRQLSRTADTLYSAVKDGKCDAFSDSILRLDEIARKVDLNAYVFNDTVAVDAMVPAVGRGDNDWASVVSGVVNMMALADQLGWSDKEKTFTRRHYFGVSPKEVVSWISSAGKKFGLSGEWAFDVLGQVGSYQSTFAANLDGLRGFPLVRRINAVATEGGLRSAGVPLERSWELKAIPKDVSPAVRTVFVATDRVIDTEADRFRFKFKSAHADNIRLAKAVVALRKTTKEASGDIWGLVYQSMDADGIPEIGLRDTESSLYGAASDFFDDIRQALQALKSAPNYKAPAILVYVHGFQNSFANSVETMARMMSNIGFPCVPVVFAWPTNGGPNYIAQRDRVADAGDALSVFLQTLHAEFNGADVHVLAHSLGSAVTIKALHELQKQGAAPVKLSELIFAAADHPPGDFYNTAKETVQGHIVDRVTSYASSNDRVFGGRGIVTASPRAGYIENGRMRQSKWVDSIDASDAIGEWKGHSNIFKSPYLLFDFSEVLAGQPMTLRSVTLECASETGYCRVRQVK